MSGRCKDVGSYNLVRRVSRVEYDRNKNVARYVKEDMAKQMRHDMNADAPMCIDCKLVKVKFDELDRYDTFDKEILMSVGCGHQPGYICPDMAVEREPYVDMYGVTHDTPMARPEYDHSMDAMRYAADRRVVPDFDPAAFRDMDVDSVRLPKPKPLPKDAPRTDGGGDW